MQQSEHKLQSTWTIYEHYQSDQKMSYKDAIQEVCRFNSVEEVCFLIKNTIYASPRQIFTDPRTSQNKIFSRWNPEDPKSEVGEMIIQALSIFKDNIHPSWEDERNKYGADMQMEVRIDDYELLDELFQHLIYMVVGQADTSSEHINGLRILDKFLQGAKAAGHARIELWVDFDVKKEENKQLTNEVEALLTQTFKKILKSEKLTVKHIPHSSSK